jgi:hypothetical protein
MNIGSYVPSLNQVANYASQALSYVKPNITTEKVCKLAGVAFAVAIIANVPTASAGPKAYANCVKAAGTNLVSIVACLPLLLIPE